MSFDDSATPVFHLSNPDEIARQFLSVYQTPHDSPELQLFRAVLDDGLRTALGRTSVGINQHGQTTEVRRARRWIFSDRDGYLYDFAFICSMLNIDPSAVRRLVREHTARPRRREYSRPYARAG